MAAIALDTNSMPHGRLDLKALTRLSKALDDQDFEDVEIWIPEPVLWEWAEHAHSRVQAALLPARRVEKEAANAGVDFGIRVTGELPTVSEVVRKLEASISSIRHVWVLHLKHTPEAAIEGLKDQILQVRAGRRKPDDHAGLVKTGASDSASFRLIEAASEGDMARVVLVSSDKDVFRHFSEDEPPICVASIWSATHGVLGLLSSTELNNKMRDSLKEALLAESEAALSQATLENEFQPFPDRYGADDGILSSSVTLTAIRSISAVTSFEFARNEDFASATASGTIDLMIEGALWDDIDDEMQHVWEEAYDIPADLQVSAYLAEDGVWSIDSIHAVIQ